MTTPYTITKEKLNDHQMQAKKLQVQLLSQMMDLTNGKRGIDEILELARHASAFTGLANYVTRMVQAKQETLKIQGVEIIASEDVSMKMISEVMSLSIVKPGRIGDLGVEAEEVSFDDDAEPTEDNDDNEAEG